MAELAEDVFLRLSPDLIEEVFFRLPPDELASLFRASAVCKPWRCILADAGFRRRYREFHRIPPVLALFDELGHFVPTSAALPAQPDHHPDWILMDCRHGRALFAEGTQVIFVSTGFGSYMVDLKAGPVRRVSGPSRKLFPYTSFYIPAMNAVPIGQGQ